METIQFIRGFSKYFYLNGDVYRYGKDKPLGKGCKNVVIYSDDGVKYTCNRGRIRYAIEMGISPRDIPKSIVFKSSGEPCDKGDFAIERGCKRRASPLQDIDVKEIILLMDSTVSPAEKYKILYSHRAELENYIKGHLRVRTATELVSATLDVAIQRITKKTFPFTVQGYLQGISRSLVKEQRSKEYGKVSFNENNWY